MPQISFTLKRLMNNRMKKENLLIMENEDDLSETNLDNHEQYISFR